MAPRIRITREAIVSAGVEIVRKEGEKGINARSIASFLQCSTQPIFSNFASMDEVKIAIIHEAEKLSQAYIQTEVAKGEYPQYKASGMAYIRFAKEEKELFKLLFMRDRSKETGVEDNKLFSQMTTVVQGNTGYNESVAELFHLEMWAFVHGIAVMFVTSFVDLPWDLVSQMLTDAYLGLRMKYEKG